jgi:hypothetical protein
MYNDDLRFGLFLPLLQHNPSFKLSWAMPHLFPTIGTGVTLMPECLLRTIGKNADAGLTFSRHSGMYNIF